LDAQEAWAATSTAESHDYSPPTQDVAHHGLLERQHASTRLLGTADPSLLRLTALLTLKGKLFRRNKVSLEEEVWMMILYLAGLSLSAVTERYGLVDASIWSIRFWVHGL
jgi:hypothetical protein